MKMRFRRKGNTPPPRVNARLENRRQPKAEPSNIKASKGKKKRFVSGETVKRAARFAGRALLMVAVTGATVFSGFAAYRHATTSDYFAVVEFEVVGLRRLTRDEMLGAAGLVSGTNVFKIDIEKSRMALVAHPWIGEAAVRRKLPRTVEITVVERRAVATILFDVPYLVDDSGEVFKRWVRGDPAPAPMLTGFSRGQFISDPDAVEEAIRDGIDLARRYRSTGLERTAPLGEICYEESGAISLTLGGEQVYVKFGRGPYRVKLKRLATLMGQLRRDGHQPAVIFLDNDVRPDRVTVKLKTQPGSLVEEKRVVALPNIQKRMSKI